jgi:hypothetical protein
MLIIAMCAFQKGLAMGRTGKKFREKQQKRENARNKKHGQRWVNQEEKRDKRAA